MSEPIPIEYDRMRAILGLPDVRAQVARRQLLQAAENTGRDVTQIWQNLAAVLQPTMDAVVNTIEQIVSRANDPPRDSNGQETPQKFPK